MLAAYLFAGEGGAWGVAAALVPITALVAGFAPPAPGGGGPRGGGAAARRVFSRGGGPPPRRHRRRLDVRGGRLLPDPPSRIALVEDLADHVERGDKIRPAVADVEPHRLTELGAEGLVVEERAHSPVEDDVFRPLVPVLLVIIGLEARRSRLAL